MSRSILLVCCVALTGCGKPAPTNFTNGGAETPAERGHAYRFSFDDTATGPVPADFISVLGAWTVTPEHALRLVLPLTERAERLSAQLTAWHPTFPAP